MAVKEGRETLYYQIPEMPDDVIILYVCDIAQKCVLEAEPLDRDYFERGNPKEDFFRLVKQKREKVFSGKDSDLYGCVDLFLYPQLVTSLIRSDEVWRNQVLRTFLTAETRVGYHKIAQTAAHTSPDDFFEWMEFRIHLLLQQKEEIRLQRNTETLTSWRQAYEEVLYFD